MREIKFRGQQKDTKIWVYGGIIQCAGIWYIYNENESFRMPQDPDFENSFIEVVPETIGQFTGLYDKNGKEIFEGDVVLYTYNEDSVKGKIVFKDLAYQIQIQDIPSVFQRIFRWSGRHIEVIGNIYENPELIV